MQIEYITFKTKNNKQLGVKKKVETQVRALTKLGVKTILKEYDFVSRVKRLLPFQTSSIDWDSIKLDEHTEGVYIRYLLSDFKFLNFLKRLKSERKIKIVVEIPTWPYDKEKMFPLLRLRDIIYRKYICQYIDYVTYIGDGELDWDVPSIKIINGIDFSQIQINEYIGVKDEINMIAVANLADWHGYDRMLNGLGKYYENGGERKIHFYIVGDGQVVKDYEKIIQRYNLQEKVTLCGTLFGDELDKVYRQCNIAVECLGIHRKKIFLSSSLKSREYAAKGLPMITSTSIDVFNENEYPYIFKCKEDETDIDICQIIEFFDTVYNNKQDKNIIREIREYAEKVCDISQTMKPIVEYFKK